MNTLSESINFTVVIVLYRLQLVNSKSFQSIHREFHKYLGDNQKVELIIVNNGPHAIECSVDERIFNLHYIECLDNPGVSKAYNLAAKLARQLDNDWMMILDQDTHLPDNFWHSYHRSTKNYPSLPVHAPRLYDGTLLISPCGYRFFRGYLLSTIHTGSHLMEGKNVLNSGLLLNVRAFWQVDGYDESVPLYFSDFVFFDRLKTCYDRFAVVNVDLAHNLSSTDYSDQATALSRFTLYSEGARAAAQNKLGKSILYFLTVGARSLLMSKRFRTFSFSRTFLATWFSMH